MIGFWYENDANAAAGKKAFIANRIGDFGLLCAMFLLAHYCGALDWNGIEQNVTQLVDPPVDALRIHLWPLGGGTYQGWASFLQPASPVTISAATAVGLALLLGCTGKSAQIPLYTWLPDAMAGPTPVSALIHAATMVTAGVYLICRLHFVFLMSPFVMMVVALVGAFTALYAATIALIQYDIKKVLAYSTVSQLGYMFLGVGVGAFSAGFFHVFTHAFFKACLFLCAGSVIHAMHARIHDNDKSQDMRNMGGLRKYMPYTYWTFAVSTAAIIGVPFLSGFFSKDEIMYRAYVDRLQSPMFERLKHEGNAPYVPPHWIGTLLFAVAVTAAVMTAFYMCRAFFMTFYGDFRGWTIGRPSMLAKMEVEEHDEHGAHHDDLGKPGYAPHESPWQMTVPLIILATGAAVAGILNMGLFHFTPIDHWLEPVFESASKAAVNEHGQATSAAALLPFGIGAFALGSYAAYHLYINRKGADEPQYIAGATRVAQAMTGILLVAIGAVLWFAVPWSTGSYARLGICGAFGLGGAWAIARYVWIGLDKLYDETVVSLVDALADTSAQFDQWVIDGILAKVTAFVVAASGTVLRAVQNGVVHLYAAMMVVGVAAIGWFFVVPHASASVTAKGTDFVVATGAAGGYLDYSYEWTQCEPDKRLWQKEWDDTMKIDDAKKRASEQHGVIEGLEAKHAKCEAPGDKWVPIAKDFSPTSEVTLHLEADADAIMEASRPVRLRAKNVFSPALGGYAASTLVYVPRPAEDHDRRSGAEPMSATEQETVETPRALEVRPSHLVWLVVAAIAAMLLSRFVDHSVPIILATVAGALVPHRYGRRTRIAIAIMCGLAALFVARMWVSDDLSAIPEGPIAEPRSFLSWLLRLSIGGALAVLFLPRQAHRLLRGFTMLVMFATLATSLYLLRVPMGRTYHFNQDYIWIQRLGIHYHVAVDGISLWLVLLTTFIMPIAAYVSFGSVKNADQGLVLRAAPARGRADRVVRLARPLPLLRLLRNAASCRCT